MFYKAAWITLMTRIGYSSQISSIFQYVDAPEDLLQGWYINRFLKFRQGAFSDPDSYFHHYAKLPEEEAVNIATQLWNEINGLNLKENILPTRERASLILTKSANHAVENVRLRK